MKPMERSNIDRLYYWQRERYFKCSKNISILLLKQAPSHIFSTSAASILIVNVTNRVFQEF